METPLPDTALDADTAEPTLELLPARVGLVELEESL